MFVDSALPLYCGLIFFFIWRAVCPWSFCGRKLEYVNYYNTMFVLLFVLTCYVLYNFVFDSGKGARNEAPKDADLSHFKWLQIVLYIAPIWMILTFGMCFFQTQRHVKEIHAGHAALKHDRAIQVIMLPAVYSVMAMNSLGWLYELSTLEPKSQDEKVFDHKQHMALARYETSIFVGDLYEAWALYQFGKLTLDLIQASINRQFSSEDCELQGPAKEFVLSITAVTSLTWLGTWLFLVVACLQAGFSLYLWVFTEPEKDWHSYHSQMQQFHHAGLVASLAAVYNCHIVERTFHHLLDGYMPFLKFLSVKLLVSLAFLQREILWLLQGLQAVLPGPMATFTRAVPMFGDILVFSDVQLNLFWAALLPFQCFIAACIHYWAWPIEEEWYDETKYPVESLEKAPIAERLDDSTASSSAQYGAGSSANEKSSCKVS
eukprot:gnl/TRDRNA2_/TRDRNA2_180305_c0_seq1.p1 gnl/TRDRNA2_/TRDRNA2_180305_c0~~gnl/TRDRNA2_/TRDRNA2_180305_c0_seq1.p1  ORF type:complete len:432 (+),score=70.96 gnl/TRDRNA2_/TRDRNA2_180305_c0_seq1:90-1385(+)